MFPLQDLFKRCWNCSCYYLTCLDIFCQEHKLSCIIFQTYICNTIKFNWEWPYWFKLLVCVVVMDMMTTYISCHLLVWISYLFRQTTLNLPWFFEFNFDSWILHICYTGSLLSFGLPYFAIVVLHFEIQSRIAIYPSSRSLLCSSMISMNPARG